MDRLTARPPSEAFPPFSTQALQFAVGFEMSLRASRQRVDSINRTSVPTNHPVPPASRPDLSESDQEGPAMSRWTQGPCPTKFSRNLAAVMAPPYLPPTFLMSATLLFI